MKRTLTEFTFILSTSSRTRPYMALLFTPRRIASASPSPSGSAPYGTRNKSIKTNVPAKCTKSQVFVLSSLVLGSVTFLFLNYFHPLQEKFAQYFFLANEVKIYKTNQTSYLVRDKHIVGPLQGPEDQGVDGMLRHFLGEGSVLDSHPNNLPELFFIRDISLFRSKLVSTQQDQPQCSSSRRRSSCSRSR